MKDINVSELLDWMDEKPNLLVLHVPSPESYQETHIPGAKNICVYEMAFLEQVKSETREDLTWPIALYGISDQFIASRKAAGMLTQAGYTNVSRLQGGLADWQAAGESVERGESNQNPAIHSGEYDLDIKASRLTWTGRNLTNAHNGELRFSKGRVAVENSSASTGHLIVEMRSLTCDDLTDETMNSVLLQHLASDDFFAVDEYPTAEYHWDMSEHLDVLPGQPNVILKGQMTIRGHTERLVIEAIQGFNNEGDFILQAHFDLDRTNWNVQYGSGKLFESLAMHLVNDHISIGLKLVGKRTLP